MKYDLSKPEEIKQYEKVVAVIKPKHISVTNLGLLKPGDVVSKVVEKLGRPFHMHHHVLCHRHFNVRPSKGAPDPTACDARFCHYDAAHHDYLYTQQWVDHLVEKLADQATYDFILHRKPVTPSDTPEAAA